MNSLAYYSELLAHDTIRAYPCYRKRSLSQITHMIHIWMIYMCLPHNLPHLHCDFIHIVGFELIHAHTHQRYFLKRFHAWESKTKGKWVRKRETERWEGGQERRNKSDWAREGRRKWYIHSMFLHDFRLTEISATDLAPSLCTIATLPW